MKSISLFILISFYLLSFSLAASLTPSESSLIKEYQTVQKNKVALKELQKQTLAQGGKAVPVLIKVMKDRKIPEANRWMATFLLGQIMGDQSAPFISKFMKHPDWVMRMAALKTLLALKQDSYATNYRTLLKDDSLLIRSQALDNIRGLNLRQEAPHVWAMLYDKRNYYQAEKRTKRAHIIKEVVRTVGDLKFKDAEKPLLKMMQKPRYKDIWGDLDYSLSQITGKKSPKGDIKSKQQYWSRMALADLTI